MNTVPHPSLPVNSGSEQAYKALGKEPSHDQPRVPPPETPLPGSPWVIGDVTDYSRIPILQDGAVIIEVLSADDFPCAEADQEDAIHQTALDRAHLITDTFNLRRAVQDAVVRLGMHCTERTVLVVAETLGQALKAGERGWH